MVKINKPDDRAAIVTLTHNGDSNFAVWSLDLSLEDIDHSNFAVWPYGTDSNLLFNEIAPFTGENVISEGPLILAVEASARWTLTVTP